MHIDTTFKKSDMIRSLNILQEYGMYNVANNKNYQGVFYHASRDVIWE